MKQPVCGALCGVNHAAPEQKPTVVKCYCTYPAGHDGQHYWPACQVSQMQALQAWATHKGWSPHHSVGFGGK